MIDTTQAKIIFYVLEKPFRENIKTNHQYEYLTDEEILLPNQSQMVKKANFTYSSLGKALEKQTETNEDGAKKKQMQLKIKVE